MVSDIPAGDMANLYSVWTKYENKSTNLEMLMYDFNLAPKDFN